MKHLLLTTIAAVLLVGYGESQQSAPSPETQPAKPVAKTKPANPKADRSLMHQGSSSQGLGNRVERILEGR